MDRRQPKRKPSEIDTFYVLHTLTVDIQDPEALRMYVRFEGAQRRRGCLVEHTTAEIIVMVRGRKASQGPHSWLWVRCDEERQHVCGCLSLGMIQVESWEWRESAFSALMYSPATCAGSTCHRGTKFYLTKTYVGPLFAGDCRLGERIAIELTPSTFPQRHFAGDRFPQRHVAGERVGMLLGKASNVVVS
ncbi:hypothetical protein Tco_0641842 [Tanacetum coccineum]|uniref:Uncharacterized protein n=1 Tax=Tanacetum coccineum TaxID=301880 RepID=A0ABQ5FTF6_9ASTR